MNARDGYNLGVLRMDEFIKKVKEIPEQEEIIEGILPKCQVMLYAGDPWQGKSLEVQKLAADFGVGNNWHGLKLKKCQSLYFTWEGAPEKISERFEKISHDFDFTSGFIPYIYLVPESLPINILSSRQKLIDIINQYSPEVVIFDSFPYTIKGNYSKDDTVVNLWWEGLQEIINKTKITPIFVWELTKLSFSDRQSRDIFDLNRLKSGYTTAYKVNTVVMIGEDKKYKSVKSERGHWETVYSHVGHKIVIAKAKDARGSFESLSVKLDANTLCWNGQHWKYDKVSGKYVAVQDGGKQSE